MSADLGTLVMKIEAESSQFERTMKGVHGNIGMIAGAVALMGVAVAGAFGGVAIKSASEFESQMAGVSTLLDGDVKPKIEALGESVKQLAISTGASTELLTDGLYQVVSAFGDTADSMDILEIASKGAIAGNSTVTDSVNLLSAVTKGYGDTSAEANKKASDLAFLTVKLGQTTFPELASSMGAVIPLASAMKVSQEELFGAMATLTGVTGGTSEVTTQLRGVIQGMMKPTADMAKTMAGLGYESGQAMIESLGLQGTLDTLKDAVGGSDTEFAKLFGSVEAVNAILALTGSQSENFTEKTLAMMDASGSTEEAFEKMSATFEKTKERIMQSINVMMIGFGEQLLPIVQQFADWLEENMPLIQEVVTTVFNKIVEYVGYAVDIFKTYLLPVLQFLYEFVSANLPTIQKVFTDAFNLIKSAIDVVWQLIEITLVPVFEALFGKMEGSTGVATIFQGAFNIVTGVIEGAIKIIQTLVDWVQKAIDLYKDLKEAMSKAGEGTASGYTSTYNNLSGGAKTSSVDQATIDRLAKANPNADLSVINGMARNEQMARMNVNITVRNPVDVAKELNFLDKRLAGAV